MYIYIYLYIYIYDIMYRALECVSKWSYLLMHIVIGIIALRYVSNIHYIFYILFLKVGLTTKELEELPSRCINTRTVSPPLWLPLRPFQIAFNVVADMPVCSVVYDRVRDSEKRAWGNGANVTV